jgi:hypothetical protein
VSDNHKLPDGVSLEKDREIFYSEGQWVLRRDGLVWSKISGWKKYYEVERWEIRFQTAEDAMKSWEKSLQNG